MDIHWFFHNNNACQWINAQGSLKIYKLLNMLHTNKNETIKVDWVIHVLISTYDIKFILFL